MKIIALISVRNKSERFPGKILKELHGQTVFEHLVDRVKMASALDGVVIATSDDPRDAVFGEIASRKSVGVFYGSRPDKLKRYLDALHHFRADAGIIIDGDDILCFPEVIDATACCLRNGDCEVVLWSGLPLGAASSGLTEVALRRVMELKSEDDTEVWGGYFRRPGLFKLVTMEPEEPLFAHPDVRMTLDYQEDLDFLHAIFDELYPHSPRFDSRELMDLLVNRHPEWNEITRPAQDRYEKNLTRAAPVRFKDDVNSMKWVVFGLGSMGKRRIRCLAALGEQGIVGFDLRADRRAEAEKAYGVKTIDDVESIDWSGIKGIIISTPPDKHQMYMRLAVEKGVPAFIEAGVILEGLAELDRAARLKKVLLAPSCTLRFHPAVKDIKRLVQGGQYGKVTSFAHYSGQYLPDWHPWENVKDFYVSKKETSACREIVPFELTWLTELVGVPKEVRGLFGHTTDVGADIDDTYAVAIKSEGCYGTLVVDVVARYAMRQLLLNLEYGQVQWRWDRPEVNFYDAREKRWITFGQREFQAREGYNRNIAEEMYIEEIRTYIQAIDGQAPWPNSLPDDMAILELLLTIEGRPRSERSDAPAAMIGAPR